MAKLATARFTTTRVGACYLIAMVIGFRHTVRPVTAHHGGRNRGSREGCGRGSAVSGHFTFQLLDAMHQLLVGVDDPATRALCGTGRHSWNGLSMGCAQSRGLYIYSTGGRTSVAPCSLSAFWIASRRDPEHRELWA